jgi:hypothetical protein
MGLAHRHFGVRRILAVRLRCTACGATRVLLPGSFLPRRADATEVVGAALLARAQGQGNWRTACDLDRPASTVRRLLRRVTSARLKRSHKHIHDQLTWDT